MIRVLVVANSIVMRTGLEALITTNPTIAVVGTSASPNTFTQQVETTPLDIIVLHFDAIEVLLPVIPVSPLPKASTQALTGREVEVLGMLAEGLGNKTIARRPTISEHTVKFHISSISSKLNASSRTEAVILGIRQGLIFI